ncbi:putative uncharacterized protein DDB_G0277255 [Maniola jurtina]|uniref:putative uncharacterized protein DDB_G0277255 n=1 Tax=Maniola jurtina TaxID=191418 RepID=UPI001E68D73E|nr:putative uncharacterized protein DDB_G0277255 [Maniola jurtina]
MTSWRARRILGLITPTEIQSKNEEFERVERKNEETMTKEVENNQENMSPPEPNIHEVQKLASTQGENDHTQLSDLASKNLSPLENPNKRSSSSSSSSSRSSSTSAASNCSSSSSSSSSDSNSLLRPKHDTGLQKDASKCEEKQSSLPSSPNETVPEGYLRETRIQKKIIVEAASVHEILINGNNKDQND